MRLWLAGLTAAALMGVTASLDAQSSPRDTTRASVGRATVVVDYGRPSKRGRDIFGGLVPYGEVWRTGANQATHFVTDKPLMFGSLMVPAGTYTIYTLPGSTSWKLIINKQTGQWGTAYDQAQDLGRVDMKVEKLAAAVEQFTIKVVPNDKGGVVRLEWDTSAAVVPFMVH
jgi:hypothetical protein